MKRKKGPNNQAKRAGQEGMNLPAHAEETLKLFWEAVIRSLKIMPPEKGPEHSHKAYAQIGQFLTPPPKATNAFTAGWFCGLLQVFKEQCYPSGNKPFEEFASSSEVRSVMQVTDSLCLSFREVFANESDESAREFFNGIHHGKEKGEECQIDRLSPRQKTQLLVACIPGLELMKMMGVHRLLQQIKILSEASDPSLTRRWLVDLGFPRSKQGRPPKFKAKK